jgi:hypothetical protein
MNFDLEGLYDTLTTAFGKFWGWVILGAAVFFLLFFIGYIFNLVGTYWAGAYKVNYAIAFILALAVAGLAFIPDLAIPILATAIASGIFQSPQTIRSEIVTFINNYTKFVGGIILWILLIFLFMAVVPLRESPGVIFPLILCSLALSLACSQFGISGNLGKKLIVWALVILTVVLLFKLVPDTVFERTIGTNPTEMFGSTDTEKELSKIRRIKAENEDRERAKRLEAIREKIEDGETLSEKEQADLNDAQEAADKRNIPGQIGKVGGKIFGGIGGIFKGEEEIPFKTTPVSAGDKQFYPPLLPGRYKVVFEPSGAGYNAYIRTTNLNKEGDWFEKIKSGRVTIPGGKMGFAIRASGSGIAKIYAQ